MGLCTLALEADGTFGQLALADRRNDLAIELDDHVAAFDVDLDLVELADRLACFLRSFRVERSSTFQAAGDWKYQPQLPVSPLDLDTAWPDAKGVLLPNVDQAPAVAAKLRIVLQSFGFLEGEFELQREERGRLPGSCWS